MRSILLLLLIISGEVHVCCNHFLCPWGEVYVRLGWPMFDSPHKLGLLCHAMFAFRTSCDTVYIVNHLLVYITFCVRLCKRMEIFFFWCFVLLWHIVNLSLHKHAHKHTYTHTHTHTHPQDSEELYSLLLREMVIPLSPSYWTKYAVKAMSRPSPCVLTMAMEYTTVVTTRMWASSANVS